jgi:hypothetical protein
LCSPTDATSRQRPSHIDSMEFLAACSYMDLSCRTACSAPRNTAESSCAQWVRRLVGQQHTDIKWLSGAAHRLSKQLEKHGNSGSKQIGVCKRAEEHPEDRVAEHQPVSR